MKRAIAGRDAPTLFALTIAECDSFRLVCETTDPPLDYLVPASRAVLAEIRAVNADAGSAIAGYTHDAGAHVHVFTTRRHANAVRRRIPGGRGRREGPRAVARLRGPTARRTVALGAFFFAADRRFGFFAPPVRRRAAGFSTV